VLVYQLVIEILLTLKFI